MPQFSHQVIPHKPVSFKKSNGKTNRVNGYHQDVLPTGDKLYPPKAKDKELDNKDQVTAEKPVEPTQDDYLGQTGYQGFEYVHTADSLLAMEIPDNFWLVDQIILNGAINFIAGDSDCGKSSLLSQLGKDICNRSSDFLGFKINSTNYSVIYVSTEDHPAGFSIKLKKQYSHINETSNEMMNFAVIFQTENILEQLENLLQKQRADLIIIDAFADMVRGDLNSSSAVRFVLEGFRNIALKYGCAIIVVHHTTKVSQGRNANKNDLVGSQAITAYARQVLMMTKDKNYHDRRILKIVKGNYLSDEFKHTGIPLVFDGTTLTFSPCNRDTDDDQQINQYDTRGIDADKPNYTPKSKKRGRRLKLKLTDLPRIKEMRSSGKTLQQIAVEYGVDKGTVSRYCKKHGVVKKDSTNGLYNPLLNNCNYSTIDYII